MNGMNSVWLTVIDWALPVVLAAVAAAGGAIDGRRAARRQGRDPW